MSQQGWLQGNVVFLSLSSGSENRASLSALGVRNMLLSQLWEGETCFSLSSGSEKRASLSALGGRNVLLSVSQLWE